MRAHYTKVEREKATIESRMVYIKDRFKNVFLRGIQKLSLKELIPNKKTGMTSSSPLSLSCR